VDSLRKTKLLSLIAVWTAVRVAATAIPTFKILGLPGSFSAAELLSPLSGILLGPIGGLIHGLLYGLIARSIFPYRSIFGMLSFLPDLAYGAAPGLLLSDRGWKPLLLFYIICLTTWYTYGNGVGLKNYMPLVTWEQWLAIVIISPPLRNFIKRKINEIPSLNIQEFTTNPLNTFLGLAGSITAFWMLAWVTKMSGVLVGNNLCFYLLNFTDYHYWVPMIPYYAFVDGLEQLIASIIGIMIVYTLAKTGKIQVYYSFGENPAVKHDNS